MKAKTLVQKKAPAGMVTAPRKMRDSCSSVVTQKVLDKDKFGQCLRALREDSDISLRTMAFHLGISPPFLSDCELGRRNLSLYHQLLFMEKCLEP